MRYAPGQFTPQLRRNLRREFAAAAVAAVCLAGGLTDPAAAQVNINGPIGQGGPPIDTHPVAGANDPAFIITIEAWHDSAVLTPTMSQGASMAISLGIERDHGSNGDVTWSVRGLPHGVTATVSPNPITGTSTMTTLTLKAALDTPITKGARFTITATPAGPAVGKSAQMTPETIAIDHPILIALPKDFDVASCTKKTVGPITITTDTTVVSGPVALELLVKNADGTIEATPPGVHASIDPPTSHGASMTHTLTLSLDADVIDSSGKMDFIVRATSAVMTVDSETFTVKGDSATITKVSPEAGKIPNSALGNEGTQVSIEGTGFCAGDKVQFGNTLAAVKPKSLDTTHIETHVPRYATSGKISLVRGKTDPVRAIAHEDFAVDSIRNNNGYDFHNFIGHISFQDLTDAFGSGQTQDHIPLCWPFDCDITFDDPIAATVLGILKSSLDSPGGGGVCFGIALSAQRIISGARPRSGFVPASAPTNFALDDASGPVDPLFDYINSQSTVQVSEEFLLTYLADFTASGSGQTAVASTYNAIKDSLARGETPLITLRYNGLAGHVVTAYDLETVKSNPLEYWIDIYDPNDQFVDGENADKTGATHQNNVTQSRIHMLSSGSWSLLSTPASGDLSGLFVIPASIIPLSPTLIGSELTQLTNSAGATLFSSIGGADGSGEQTSALVSKTTQLADQAGHTLFANGFINKAPATRLDAAPFLPFINVNSENREMFVATAANGPIVQTVTGLGAGADTHIIVGRGMAVRVDTTTTANDVDRLTFDGKGGIGFATDGEDKPVTLGVMAKLGTDTRSAEIATTTTKTAGESLEFSADHSGIVVQHGSAAPVRLRLSATTPKGGASVFDSEPFMLESGEQMTFAPPDWTHLDTIIASIRNTAGTVRSLQLANQVDTAAVARVDALPISNETDSAGNHAVTVQTTLLKIPSGARVYVDWVARRGGTIVAGGVNPITGEALRAGARSDKFALRSTGAGDYDVVADIVVVQQDGAINIAHKQSRSVTAKLP
jgi:hypothetical protein